MTGGNVRVDLEDSLFIGRGRLATSNVEQVVKIRRIVEELGHSVATPSDAREMLVLKGAIKRDCRQRIHQLRALTRYFGVNSRRGLVRIVCSTILRNIARDAPSRALIASPYNVAVTMPASASTPASSASSPAFRAA